MVGYIVNIHPHLLTHTTHTHIYIYNTGHLECQKNPYQKQTWNSKIQKTMGDIDIETKRWNRRVKQYGYNYNYI